METDRVTGPGARHELPVFGTGLGELAFEPNNESIHPVVCDEQVRAEPDRDHVHTFLGGPGESLLEL